MVEFRNQNLDGSAQDALPSGRIYALSRGRYPRLRHKGHTGDIKSGRRIHDLGMALALIARKHDLIFATLNGSRIYSGRSVYL